MTRAPHLFRSVVVPLASLVVAAPATRLAAAPPLLDSPARSFHTGDQVNAQAYRPSDVAIADFDEDGFPDVALAHDGNFIAPKFSIHLNRGDGTLGPPATVATSEETERIIAADFTGDGHVDVALSEANFNGNHIFLFPGNGDGSFGPQRSTVVPPGPERPAAADLDNDGDLDMAVAHVDQEKITILRNTGAGFFTTSTIALPGGEPFAVAAGDVDGDGWTDLAVSPANAAFDVAILRNDGTGAFAPPVFVDPGTYGRRALALADLDGDGALDVVVSTAWLRNQGDGSFGPSHALPVLPLYSYFDEVEVADLNGDGDADFVGLRYFDYDAGWLLIESDGAGGFAPPRQIRSGEYAQGIAVADMDQDGDRDVVVVNHGSLTVIVHENDGGIRPLPDVSYNGGWLAHDVEAGDLDRDGDLDLVSGASFLARHMNDGNGAFTAHEFNPILGQKYRMKLRDVNGDLYPDLLFIRHPNTPPYDFYWALNNGDGSFGEGHVLPLSSCGTGDLDTVDFDLDGDLDVVISDHLGCPSQEGVKLILVRNEGGGAFSLLGKIINFLSEDPFRVVTGDFDNDGIGDVIGTLSERVAFWKGNGDGTFEDQLFSDIDPSGSNERGPWFVVADDFDGDGNLDLATLNGGWTLRGENVTVLLGRGDGTFVANGLHYAAYSLWFGGVGGITSLDVDGDGDRDIAVGARYGSHVVLLVNDGTGTFTLGDRYGVDGNPTDILTGDFDGDGREDVAAQVVLDFDGGVTVLRGVADAPVPGDVDGDGSVGFGDLVLLLSMWGPCDGACPGDLDGSGDVGFSDLLILLANWG